MPIYRFICEECDHEEELFVVDRKNYDIPECENDHGEMKKAPAAPFKGVITEKDKTRNKNVKRGITDQLKKRSHEHFVKNEMPDLIKKYGPKQAEEFGWIDKKTGKAKKLIDEK